MNDILQTDMPIVDSNMSQEEAMADKPGMEAPQGIRDALRLLTITYWSHDEKVHQGQLVVHKMIEDQVIAAFSDLFDAKIPITKMVPMPAYNWDDESSIQENNCSSYCYRQIADKPHVLSLHAAGLAFDIDPRTNPWVKGDKVQPEGAVYDPTVYGTLTKDSEAVKIMKKHGFFWGGDWLKPRGYADYQHFDINPYDNSTQIVDELREQGVLPTA